MLSKRTIKGLRVTATIWAAWSAAMVAYFLLPEEDPATGKQRMRLRRIVEPGATRTEIVREVVLPIIFAPVMGPALIVFTLLGDMPDD